MRTTRSIGLIGLIYMTVLTSCQTTSEQPSGGIAVEHLRTSGFTSVTSTYEKRVMVEGRVGKKREKFMVDTGASRCVMPRDAAERLGLSIEKSDAPKMHTPVGPSIRERDMAIMPSLQLGARQIQNLPFTLFDRQTWLQEHYYATKVLGADMLEQNNAIVAAGTGTIFFHDTPIGPDYGRMLSDMGYREMKVQASHHVLRCAVSISGQPRLAIIDTGAEETYFDARMLPESEILETIEEASVSFDGFGNPMTSRKVRIRNLSIGGVSVGEATVLIRSVESENARVTPCLIGYKLMRKLDMIVDFGNERAFIRP